MTNMTNKTNLVSFEVKSAFDAEATLKMYARNARFVCRLIATSNKCIETTLSVTNNAKRNNKFKREALHKLKGSLACLVAPDLMQELKRVYQIYVDAEENQFDKVDMQKLLDKIQHFKLDASNWMLSQC